MLLLGREEYGIQNWREDHLHLNVITRKRRIWYSKLERGHLHNDDLLF